MESKLKIALIFTEDLTTSWIQTGIIPRLNQYQADITVFAPDKLSNITGVDNQEIDFLSLTLPASTKGHKWLRANIVMNRRRSSSFLFRLKRLRFGDYSPRGSGLSGLPQKLRKLLYSGYRFIIYAIEERDILLCYLPILRGLYFDWIGKKFLREDFRDDLTELLQFDMVIFPSRAVDHWTYALIRDCKRMKIFTVLAIENWDNLTSKTLLIEPPDIVLAPGASIISQASAINQLPSERFISAGLPRFNIYRNSQQHKVLQTQASNPNKLNILYLGFSVPYLEKETLNKIRLLLQESKYSQSMTIRYRPHPRREKRMKKEIALSSEIDTREASDGQDYTRGLTTVDEGYIQEILWADIVLATPTTMALESMLLNRRTLIDVCDDGFHRTSPSHAIKNYLHLSDLYRVKGLEFFATPESAVELIQNHKHREQSYDISEIVDLSASCYSEVIMKIPVKNSSNPLGNSTERSDD